VSGLPTKGVSLPLARPRGRRVEAEMPSEHYYTPRPSARSRPGQILVPAGGRTLVLATEAGVFSRSRLDAGSRLLMKALAPLLPASRRLLDLGCGYGPVGLWAAASFPHLEVVLTDINERAVGLCRRNIAANGINNATVCLGDGYQPVAGEAFDLVATNPPIRAGMAVVTAFIADAPAHLRPGGSLLLVARTRQGARTFARIMGQYFPVVGEVEKGGGYRVYRADNPQQGG